MRKGLFFLATHAEGDLHFWFKDKTLKNVDVYKKHMLTLIEGVIVVSIVRD